MDNPTSFLIHKFMCIYQVVVLTRCDWGNTTSCRTHTSHTTTPSLQWPAACLGSQGYLLQFSKFCARHKSCKTILGNFLFIDKYANYTEESSGARGHSAKYAPRNIPEAQCAFKGLMIHEVMQFALRIAFRCVLHRCGSLDIHR